MPSESYKKMLAALNKVAKWRMVFAGWQLGTRADNDPEAMAVRDHREQSIMMRTEVSALVRILLEKKVFTIEEWESVITDEAEKLSEILRKRFPGFTATDYGMKIDVALAQDTTRGWKP